jgi:hypothetical protein
MINTLRNDGATALTVVNTHRHRAVLMATAISYETEKTKRRSAQERESFRVVFGVRLPGRVRNWGDGTAQATSSLELHSKKTAS